MELYQTGGGTVFTKTDEFERRVVALNTAHFKPEFNNDADSDALYDLMAAPQVKVNSLFQISHDTL